MLFKRKVILTDEKISPQKSENFFRGLFRFLFSSDCAAWPETQKEKTKLGQAKTKLAKAKQAKTEHFHSRKYIFSPGKILLCLMILTLCIGAGGVQTVRASGVANGSAGSANTITLSAPDYERPFPADGQYTLKINGYDIALSDYSTYGILQVIGDHLGFDVEWDEENRVMNVYEGERPVLAENEFPLYVDGVDVPLSNYTINSSTYVRLRSLGELLGFDVEWDEENHVIIINTEKLHDAEKLLEGQSKRLRIFNYALCFLIVALIFAFGILYRRLQKSGAGTESAESGRLRNSESFVTDSRAGG